MSTPALKPGDVCFVMHHDSILSRTIGWFMDSQWSHSFIVLEVTPLRTYILETSDFNVTFGHLERYLEDPNVSLEAYTSDMTVDQGAAMMQTVVPLYNTLYAYLQLASYAVILLLAKIGIHLKNHVKQGLLCDEIIMMAYAASPYPEFKGLNPYQYQTESVYQLFKANPHFSLAFSKAEGQVL